jgi:hypothetical protein
VDVIVIRDRPWEHSRKTREKGKIKAKKAVSVIRERLYRSSDWERRESIWITRSYPERSCRCTAAVSDVQVVRPLRYVPVVQ